MEFIRKYIHVAKLVKPVLTQEASDYIAEEYSRLRSHDQVNSDSARTMPVTARALETMIRLSTAHAKARMSKTVDLADAEAALELMQFAYFKKILEKVKKRKVPEDSEIDVSQSQETDSQRSLRKRSRISKDGDDVEMTQDGEDEDPYDFTEDENTQPSQKSRPASQRSSQRKKTDISQERFKTFKTALVNAFKVTRSQSVAVPDLLTHINQGQDEEFDQNEINLLLECMQDDNQVMVSEDVVFLI